MFYDLLLQSGVQNRQISYRRTHKWGDRMTDNTSRAQTARMETIFCARFPLLCAIAGLTALIALLQALCGRLLPEMPPPYSTSVLAVCNVLLLAAALCLLRCVIRLFHRRPLLRVSQAGLWFRLSRKQQGRIAWDHIAHIALAPDGTSLQLYLCGLPEVNEQISLTPEPGGGRVLTLPLRGKVRSPQQVCALLRQYRDRFAVCPARSVPGGGGAGTAAASRHGTPGASPPVDHHALSVLQAVAFVARSLPFH